MTHYSQINFEDDEPTPIELSILSQMARDLDAGVYTYAGRIDSQVFEDVAGAAFNMGTEGHKRACGTVACIGGWLSHYLGGESRPEMQAYVVGRKTFEHLFYPFRTIPLNNITPKQAAQAIRNYLEGEVANPWGGVFTSLSASERFAS